MKAITNPTLFWLKCQWWTVQWSLANLLDKFQWFVAGCLPRWLVSLAFARVFAYGTTGKFGNTDCAEVRAITLARRWGESNV